MSTTPTAPYTLHCTRCNCKIVQSQVCKPNNSQYYTHIYIHNNANDSNATVGSVYTPEQYVVVTDQFDFDNVGVSKNVPVQPSAGSTQPTTDSSRGAQSTEHGEYKYLVCADCDYGPIGITYNSQPSVFYVVPDKCTVVQQ